MNKIDFFKNYYPYFIIIIAVLCIIYLPNILKNNDKYDLYYGRNSGNIVSNKYKVNEYIPVYVNDEQMSSKYLNDYLNNIFNDLDSSYNLLNKEYKEYKFDGIDDYKTFINSLDLSNSVTVYKYATYERKGFKYYDVYDNNGNRFIFKTNGVMQYEVLFDDYFF